MQAPGYLNVNVGQRERALLHRVSAREIRLHLNLRSDSTLSSHRILVSAAYRVLERQRSLFPWRIHGGRVVAGFTR